jgi:MATE family multidrug resistance protein
MIFTKGGTSRSELDQSRQTTKTVVQASSQEIYEEISENSHLLQNAADENGPVTRSEVKVAIQYSAPLVLANLLQFSLNVTSMIVIGGRGKIDLGAVSVASMTANITGLVVIQGLCTSLDTLCPQAWGAGSKKLVGLHVQRMVLLLWCASIPIACFWFSSSKLLAHILPDPEMAALASLYLRILVLGLPGFAVFEAGKRILTSQGKFFPVMCILFIGAFVNVVASWLFVWVSSVTTI